VFFRAFFALVPIALFAMQTVGLRAMVQTARPGLHIVRAAVGSSGMFLNFAALKLLPLADITAFGFVQPIFGNRILANPPNLIGAATMTDGRPARDFLQLRHDFEQLLGEQARETSFAF
jgi:hypothetical protein